MADEKQEIINQPIDISNYYTTFNKLRDYSANKFNDIISIDGKTVIAMVSVDNLKVYAKFELSEKYKIISCFTQTTGSYIWCWFQPTFKWCIVYNDEYIEIWRDQFIAEDNYGSYRISFNLQTRDFCVKWYYEGWITLAEQIDSVICVFNTTFSSGDPSAISFTTNKHDLPIGYFMHTFNHNKKYKYTAPLTDKYNEACVMQAEYANYINNYTPPNNTLQSEDCLACASSKKIMVATKCMHLCYCESCSNGQTKCPICRAATSFKKVYF